MNRPFLTLNIWKNRINRAEHSATRTAIQYVSSVPGVATVSSKFPTIPEPSNSQNLEKSSTKRFLEFFEFSYFEVFKTHTLILDAMVLFSSNYPMF